ncbi:hypothetical protein ACF05L_19425 [Streptomyces bobili]|uniref:hypothetical protein n=1 Tax=Streptomyces bobili TaxID=67280 RepID=UPI0036F9240F
MQDDGFTHGAAAGMGRLAEIAARRSATAGRISLARLLASSPPARAAQRVGYAAGHPPDRDVASARRAARCHG